MRERSYGEDFTPQEAGPSAPFQEAELLAIAEPEGFDFGGDASADVSKIFDVPHEGGESAGVDALLTSCVTDGSEPSMPSERSLNVGAISTPISVPGAAPKALSTPMLGPSVASLRVRFHAPLVLKPEYADVHSAVEPAYDGTVLNLSEDGVACVAPLEMSVGERVWVNFRLGLGEKPLTFLSEVIWRRYENDKAGGAEEVRYGLRFRSLTATERAKLGAVVMERAQGRAGAWPMPVLSAEELLAEELLEGALPEHESVMSMEHVEAAPMEPVEEAQEDARAAGLLGSSFRAWKLGSGIAIAGGLAVGAGLALAVAMENGTSDLPNDPSPQAAATSIDFGAVPLADDVVGNALYELDSTVARALAPKDKSQGIGGTHTATQNDPRGETVVLQHATKAEYVTKAALYQTPQSSPVSARLPRKDKHPAPKIPAGVDALRPGGTDTMALALLADGDVGDYKSFWLDNPRRLVIDIPHRKNGFAKSDYVIDHPLAQRLRIGNHADHVRFVLETAETVRKEVKIEAKGTALAVVLRSADAPR